MGFFLSFLIIIAIQTAVSFVLQMLGLPVLYIEMIVNLVLAFVFTYWNFSRIRDRKEIFKDVSFHVNICIWYAILTGINVISYFLY